MPTPTREPLELVPTPLPERLRELAELLERSARELAAYPALSVLEGALETVTQEVLLAAEAIDSDPRWLER